MLRNFFKLTLRVFWRNKTFSVINILGLAIGMTSALLIGLWVQNELNYDNFYTSSDRVYQLYSREKGSSGVGVWGRTSSPLAAELRANYPEVEAASRLRTVYFLLTQGDKHFNLGGAFADSSLFRILDFPFAQGDPTTALNETHNIVLTQHLARSLFGDADPIGKAVRIDSTDIFKVTGVLKDLPTNTQFSFEYLLPWTYVDQLGWDKVGGTWQFTNSGCFIRLKAGASLTDFNKKVLHINRQHISNGQVAARETFAYPILRDHLYDRVDNGQLVAGRLRTVQFFIIIAVFILLIACINFMNLSTARSEKRAREVGIRKVHGALRTSLVTQFIGESIFLAAIAFILAIGLVKLCLNPFDQVIDIPLTLDLTNSYFWLFSIGFILFTGILAGSYPAFFLSAARPIKVLKGISQKINTPISPRKVLVVVQFTFAIILITSTLIVENQLNYARSRENGFDKDRLVFTFVQGDVLPHYDAIKRDLLSSGAAIGVTKLFSPITRVWGANGDYSWPNSTDADKSIIFTQYEADADFVKTTGTHLVEGRDLDLNNYLTDSTAALLNETAVRMMRLDHPVGRLITDPTGARLHVVGVVKDFIIANPYSPVSPMVIRGLSTGYPVIHFRLDPNRPIATSIALAEKIFRKYNPQYPFDYFFVDDAYNAKFRTEQQEGTLGILFAGLTIFISCLGLFGLAAYMAESRRREIGIRKVLGATVGNITLLISGDFIKLVLIALLIATPIAWYSMNSWLAGYTYHIRITIGVFLLAGLLAIAIALLTVGYQSIRAGLANPIKSLHAE
jgi:putative ABC transport system permease protein